MRSALATPTTLTVVSKVDEAVQLFPHEVIRRYAADFNLTEEEAKLHAVELVRYLVLCAENPDSDYGMAGQVDEVWHLLILHTMEYARWCDQVFGYFVHHNPTLPEEKEQVKAGDAPDTYAIFYGDYPLYFGEQPPSVWPVPMGMHDCHNCSTSRCHSAEGTQDCHVTAAAAQDCHSSCHRSVGTQDCHVVTAAVTSDCHSSCHTRCHSA